MCGSGVFAFIASFTQTIINIYLAVFCAQLCQNCYFLNIFPFITENYSKDLVKIAPNMLALFNAISTLCFPIFDYLF